MPQGRPVGRLDQCLKGGGQAPRNFGAIDFGYEVCERGFLERAATSIAQAQRSGIPAALIGFDIDHFKAINDGYGHGAGDEVLRNIAKVLLLAMRPGDLLGRLGSEEFAVLLYVSTVVGGDSIADRLRVEVRAGVAHPAGAGRQVTVSGGVAPAHGAFESETVLSLALTIADEALYAAKRAGRDRIVAAQAADAGAGPLVRADVTWGPVPGERLAGTRQSVRTCLT